MKTVTLEDLTPETQHIVENWLFGKMPVAIERAGYLGGELESLELDDNISLEMTAEEEEELIEIVRRGKEDIAAGRGVSIEVVRARYMEKMRGSAK